MKAEIKQKKVIRTAYYINKPSKYRNVKTRNADGTVSASKKEANRRAELYMLQRAGEISELREQVPFELIPKQPGERNCVYIADFVYKDKNGIETVEDTKGYRPPEYVIKRKLMLYLKGIKILET